jgi:hypothetical protein
VLSQAFSILAGSFVRAPWGWGLFVLCLVAFFRIMPLLSAQAIEALAQRRREKRDDLSDCQRRLDEMGREVRALANSFTNLKIDLSAALSAYRILEVEVETNNPASMGLAEARAVLSAAFTIAPSTEGMERNQ